MPVSPTRVARPPSRPLMVWDGDCRFCGMWIRRWHSLTGDQVDYQPYQQVGRRFPELAENDYAQAVHLILPDGTVLRAAAAVFASLAFAAHYGWALRLYRRSPLFARATESGYRFVARHRTFFSRLTRLLWGEPAPSTYRFGGFLFVRLVGLIFLIAFVSFGGQAGGLVGDHGILPIRDYFLAFGAELNPTLSGWDRFWTAPSLLWLAPNNDGLIFLLLSGGFCSCLVMAGVVPAWALLGCLITYGSLRNGVPVFLDFQWDCLLLETGFVALLVSPWGWSQKLFALRDPPRIGRWVAWWTFFKLMFLSGLVKILTNGPGLAPEHPNAFRRFIAWLTGVPVGENTWLDGTALQFHYFTQPIPVPASFWFAHLPPWFQAGSLWFTLFIEIVTPFAFFGPRRVRHAAALLQLLLQGMLLLTGNYGFFNLLAIALCLFLLDDAFWPPRIQRLLNRGPAAPVRAPASSPSSNSKLETRNSKLLLLPRLGASLRSVAAALIVLIGLIQIWESWLSRTRAGPPPGEAPADGPVARAAHLLSAYSQRLGLVNSYGLFRVMTTERPEIIIEGSQDGTHWLPYEFFWKPGDVLRPPSYTTPHMPRLDWQMWFAALEIDESRGQSIPFWLPRFLYQLQLNNPEVLALLANNPFPHAPPNYLRLRVFLYTFATPEEHEKTGAWWTHPADPELTLTAQPRAAPTAE